MGQRAAYPNQQIFRDPPSSSSLLNEQNKTLKLAKTTRHPTQHNTNVTIGGAAVQHRTVSLLLEKEREKKKRLKEKSSNPKAIPGE